MIKYTKDLCLLVVCFLPLLFIFSCTKNKTLTTIEQGIFKKSKTEDDKKRLMIVPGDTLKSISQKYNVTIQEIVK